MSAKLAKYDRLYEQIKGYVQTTDDIWARLATMEAVLHHKMQTFFWEKKDLMVEFVAQRLEAAEKKPKGSKNTNQKKR